METKDFVLGYGAGKNSAVSEKIVEEVDAWLDEHITNPDSPPLDRSLTSSSAAAPADMVGDINDEVGELRNAFDKFDTELYNGCNTLNLGFKNGWINGSGIYNPSNTKFLSRTFSSTKAEVINNTSSAVYIIYFTAFSSLSSYTFSNYQLINAKDRGFVDITKPYFLVESDQTDMSVLSEISVEISKETEYLSYANIGHNLDALKAGIGNIYASDVAENKFGILAKALKGSPDPAEVHVSWDEETDTLNINNLVTYSSTEFIGSYIYPIIENGKSYVLALEYLFPLDYPSHYVYISIEPTYSTTNSGQNLLSNQLRTNGDKEVIPFTATGDGWLNIRASISAGATTTLSVKVALYDVTDVANSFIPKETFLSFPSAIYVPTSGGILQDSVYRIKNGDYADTLTLTQPIVLSGYSIGDVVDLSPLNKAGTSHYTTLIGDVQSGEKFYVNVTDGNNARPWAFLDSSYKLLSMNSDAYAQEMEIIAPANAKYLLIQVGQSYFPTAYIIREYSFSYLSGVNANSTKINHQNPAIEITEKLENASAVTYEDSSTSIKSRANLLNLIHFSDIHGDTDNIQRLLDFYNQYSDYIYDIIHTGDSPLQYYSDDNPFATVGGNQILNVVGNHECWISGDTWPHPYNATAAQVYTKFFAPYISEWNVISPSSNLCYYYKDYSTAKVRLIVLDAIHYDSAQESWFEATLAGAKANDYRVVTVSHYPAQTGITGFDCTFNSIVRLISPVADPEVGEQIERLQESAFDVVDNFINDGGEFVCWLSGHQHDDFIGVVKDHTQQIQIIISCGLQSNKYSDCARTSKTKTQDLFNVFTVDGNAKLIKLIRVGSTMDKFMRKRETLCINYNTKEIISNN